MRGWLVCLIAGLVSQLLVGLALISTAPAGQVTRPGVETQPASPSAIGRVAFAPPVEERLRNNTVRSVRSTFWWQHRFLRTVEFALKKWWTWSGRLVVFFSVAIAASLIDRQLLNQWRTNRFGVLTTYVPLAVVVYFRLLLDRRADRIGKFVLVGALVYGVLPWDLIPDGQFTVGLLDDTVVVAAASRWFMYRCPAALIEQHARFVEAWRSRTREIQSYRRRLQRRAAPEDSDDTAQS